MFIGVNLILKNLKMEVQNNEEMLSLLREERPDQIIHKVYGFKKNKYGFYNVEVDMQLKIDLNNLFDSKCKYDITTVKHTRQIIAYPLKKLHELDKSDQHYWLHSNII